MTTHHDLFEARTTLESASGLITYYQFSAHDCTPCPVRTQCTRAKGAPRELVVLPRDRYEALQAAKERQKTEAFRQEYVMRGDCQLGNTAEHYAKRVS